MKKRADALDALRGLAILLMILSGSIPFGGALPAWMYHAQVPPPVHSFDPTVAGITWVDLVFPFFLFAMGAAFPLALNRRLEKGIAKWKISIQIIQRGLLLAAFAIFIQHVKPYALNPTPSVLNWLTGITGFLLLFIILLRYPKSVNNKIVISLKSAGVVIAVVLLYFLEYPKGGSFSTGRSDIIILVLANTALFGSLIWLFTRKNILLRLGILGFLIAMRLTHDIDGSWNQWLWNFSPFPWLYKFYYLQYLFIVIPGTIIGDFIYKWLNSEEKEKITGKWSIYIPFIFMLILLCNLVCLFSRNMELNLLLNVLLLGAAWYFLKAQKSVTGNMFYRMFQWGSFWLLLGLFFEAFEGGIKKDHSTLSYYFVTTGLAIFTYITFSIIIDILKYKKPFRIITESGQNPMIAYIAGSNLILPVLTILTVEPWLSEMSAPWPWIGFLKGVIFTFLVALTAAIFTRKKLFWRT